MITELILLGLAVSTFSVLATKAKITEPVRMLVECVPFVGNFLGELFSCPFCFAFWVTTPLQLVYRIKPLVSRFAVLDWFIGYLCVVGVAALFSGIIYMLISRIE